MVSSNNPNAEEAMLEPKGEEFTFPHAKHEAVSGDDHGQAKPRRVALLTQLGRVEVVLPSRRLQGDRFWLASIVKPERRSMTMPIVHIVDDDASLRAALTALLDSVGLKSQAYGTTEEFLISREADSGGCLLLDVRLPGTNGLAFQERLVDLGVRLPVILMTGHGDIPMSVRAMKAGAIDFLPKPFRDQDLLDAIDVALDRDRRRREEDAAGAGLRAKHEKLTTREKQVMFLVTAGKMNKQVAGELSLSEVTVKIHRRSAMQKMGARTLADLVRMAEMLALHRSADQLSGNTSG
ncbi:response regulator transcription factor [Devosia ureilytica]